MSQFQEKSRAYPSFPIVQTPSYFIENEYDIFDIQFIRNIDSTYLEVFNFFLHILINIKHSSYNCISKNQTNWISPNKTLRIEGIT
jgi:hypothetical protein